MKTLEELIKDRDKLRLQYQQAMGSDRKIISMRGKLLGYAIARLEEERLIKGFFQ